MPYNFTPLEYNPYGYSSTVGSKPVYDASAGRYEVDGRFYPHNQDPAQWDARSASDQHSQFQNYSGNQFQSLFDAVNSIGSSPFTSGDAFYNTPQYTPINRNEYVGYVEPTQDDESNWIPGYDTFDQQGYDTARMDNMMGYMGDLGGFFRGLGSTPAQQTQQQVINNAPSQGQGPALSVPQVGGSFGATPQGGNNPFPQFTPQSGGWGQAPTSLFGAGTGTGPIYGG